MQESRQYGDFQSIMEGIGTHSVHNCLGGAAESYKAFYEEGERM